MEHLLAGLASFATHLLSQFGISGVFLGMLLESACIPLPSEIIMPFGGYLASTGQLSFLGVVIAGILGNVAGSWIAYEIGKRGGRKLLHQYGHFVLFSNEHLETAERWFSRYGEWTVFFGRILPVVRTFISLPAGIANMHRAKFLFYTFLGCLPWCFLFAYIGLKLGQNWQTVRNYLHRLDYPIIALVVIGFVWFLARNRKRGRR